MEEKKKRWRPSLTAYRELESELEEAKKELSRSQQKRNDVVSLESYKELEQKVGTLEKSNNFMEKELARLRDVNEEITKNNAFLESTLTHMRNRGFWSRVFNK